jgi:hypothetical protein
MTRKLLDAGFAIDALLGDYRGAAWDERADVWIILARRLEVATRGVEAGG